MLEAILHNLVICITPGQGVASWPLHFLFNSFWKSSYNTERIEFMVITYFSVLCMSWWSCWCRMETLRGCAAPWVRPLPWYPHGLTIHLLTPRLSLYQWTIATCACALRLLGAVWCRPAPCAPAPGNGPKRNIWDPRLSYPICSVPGCFPTTMWPHCDLGVPPRGVVIFNWLLTDVACNLISGIMSPVLGKSSLRTDTSDGPTNEPDEPMWGLLFYTVSWVAVGTTHNTHYT